jgi:hypothetical protein
MRSTCIIVFVLLALHSVAHGFVCPTDGLFMNADDENTYFKCELGIASRISCPSGLVWDQINQVCEWPSVQGLSICLHLSDTFCFTLTLSEFLHK